MSYVHQQTANRLLPFPELIQRTSLKKTKLYELINAGELHPIKLGRKTVFSEIEVNQWIFTESAFACQLKNRLGGGNTDKF